MTDCHEDLFTTTSLHVRRAIEGNGDSKGWLFLRLLPLLLHHADSCVGQKLRSVVDPEDLVQDAWAIVMPRFGSLKAHDGRYAPVLLKFLSSTITHLANDLMRRQVRRKMASRKEKPSPESDTSESINQFPARDPSVSFKLVQDEMAINVSAAFAELDPKDQSIILRRGVEALSYREITELTKEPEATLRQRYKRAIERLRAKIPGSIYHELTEE